MSFEISRRNFLKYSAVAAVAVAGAGLFSGCQITSDTENLYRLSAGEMTVLSITAAMGTKTKSGYTTPKVSGTTTITFPMQITNGRTNAVSIASYNFKVTVVSKDGTTTKYAGTEMSIPGSLCDTNLKKGSSTSGDIVLTLPKALEKGATVTLTYCPDLKYAEYTMNWRLTVS